MAEFSKLVITRKGQALIAKMLAGTAADIEFPSVAASDASYSIGELEGLESLSAIMQEADISRKTRTNEVAVKLETAFTNTELTVGYHMRTLGLYANDPDDGKILYAVCVETSGNCYIPPYNGITVSGAYIQLITTVGNADHVSLEVNPSVLATIGNINEVMERIDNLIRSIMLGEIAASLTTAGSDTLQTGDGIPLQAAYKIGSMGNIMAAVAQQISAAKQEAIAAAASEATGRASAAKREAVSAAAADASAKVSAARSDLTAAISAQIAAHNTVSTAHPSHLAVVTKS